MAGEERSRGGRGGGGGGGVGGGGGRRGDVILLLGGRAVRGDPSGAWQGALLFVRECVCWRRKREAPTGTGT